MLVDLARLRGLVLMIAIGLIAVAGCATRRHANSPTSAGYNIRDLVDANAQPEAERVADIDAMLRVADQLRATIKPAVLPPKKTVLCLSGGGAYGAFSAGVLYGWTGEGNRPNFDVVTGISTGALIAPFAFLGPRYDEAMKQFYTTVRSKDIYKLRVVKGLFSESLADNAPLAHKVNEVITPELMAEIAEEHRKGRRLYVGTTELEGRRFVFWDIGAIASAGTEDDRQLLKLILLGSSAIPGFFPPAKIPVTINGQSFIEKHVDGGVSQAVFMRRPFVPLELANDPTATSTYGSDVYAIIAGKLHADPEEMKPRALKIAGSSVSAIIYAQTRGDLQRMWTLCQLTGMNFHMTAIPAEYPAPKSSTEFKPDVMTGMFDEGVRLVRTGKVWRKTPPGVELGEGPLKRASIELTHQQRGPASGTGPSAPISIIPRTPMGMPVPIDPIQK